MPVPPDALFCENDGTRLKGADAPLPGSPNVAAAAIAVASDAPLSTDIAPDVATDRAAAQGGCRCGAGPGARSADGFCTACGRKWVAPRTPLPRDHRETALSPRFAGVTDRGQRHSKNEDDFAIALADTDKAVLVVCDGVSSSEEADRASAIAAKTICARLSEPFADGDAETALRGAVAAANVAVSALHSAAPGAVSDPPETTVVAAVVRERTAVIAWVGDSRAYWIDGASHAADSRLLTHDHSWMNEVVDSGEMTAEEAGKNRLAHAITRCLGASDDPEGSEPTVTTFAFPRSGGYLLLCTDGLWNYAETAAQLADRIRAERRTEGDSVGIARGLVAWANAQGGRDNITAALLAVPAVPDLPIVTEENI